MILNADVQIVQIAWFVVRCSWLVVGWFVVRGWWVIVWLFRFQNSDLGFSEGFRSVHSRLIGRGLKFQF